MIILALSATTAENMSRVAALPESLESESSDGVNTILTIVAKNIRPDQMRRVVALVLSLANVEMKAPANAPATRIINAWLPKTGSGENRSSPDPARLAALSASTT